MSIILDDLMAHDANAGDAPEMEAKEYKRPLVIYHGNCADGFSAAWCFYDYARKQEDRSLCDFEYHAGVYQETPPDVTGRVVFLVDFSYKKDVVKEMLKVAEKVYLIDHHKTAIEDLVELMDNEDYPNFSDYVDLERSGAMLAWDFLYNCSQLHDEKIESRMYNYGPEDHRYIAPPTLLGHIQDRDLWKFKLPNTREIQANVFSYEYTFENWDMLMLETSTLTLAEGGMAIERKHFKDIKELIKVGMYYAYLEGGTFAPTPVLNCPYFFSSDAGLLMAKEHPSQMAACYYDTGSKRIFSLRSLDDGPDVSEIAKFYGGGGHKHAAGFFVPKDHPLGRI